VTLNLYYYGILFPVILSNALYTIKLRVNLLIELIKALAGLIFILKNDAFKWYLLLKLKVRVIARL
jgi:hypothetical protein